jgi:hypothetical protein
MIARRGLGVVVERVVDSSNVFQDRGWDVDSPGEPQSFGNATTGVGDSGVKALLQPNRQVATEGGDVCSVPDNPQELGDFTRQALTRKAQPQLVDQNLESQTLGDGPTNHHSAGVDFES